MIATVWLHRQPHAQPATEGVLVFDGYHGKDIDYCSGCRGTYVVDKVLGWRDASRDGAIHAIWAVMFESLRGSREVES